MISSVGVAQDLAYQETYETAYSLALKDDYSGAKKSLKTVLKENPDDADARFLLARINSWIGFYNQARNEFNTITSKERENRDVWISSIKNELYAKKGSTALGLANKALVYLEGDEEIERLRLLALDQIKTARNKALELERKKREEAKKQKKALKAEKKSKKAKWTQKEINEMTNRIGVNNSMTVFSIDREATFRTSISFKKKTKFGSIIPALNYNNRAGGSGVQYNLDMYPKISKTFYAYLNYGYSNANIYPIHKAGGDLYANLPGPYEASGGVRFAQSRTRNVTSVTNSLGMYKGNYYFSLRSYITPRPDNLTRVSGNLLVRKYFRNGDNFLGFGIGMGYSPELRQLTEGDEILAETLLYIESQRASIQYRYSPRKSPNIYNFRLGLTRQEIASNSGTFFIGITGGMAYQVKF